MCMYTHVPMFKNNFYHVIIWIILSKASLNYQVKCNLGASHTALLKPTLNEQKDFEILFLFRHCIT